MPCRDDYRYEPNYEAEKLQKRNDILARLLCSACRLLVSNKITLPSELDEWYVKHIEFDKREGRI
jgi:hypothetical protein